MAFLDILRTFDCIPLLDAFLLFSASNCSEISHGLTWINRKDGKLFAFFFILNMLSSFFYFSVAWLTI